MTDSEKESTRKKGMKKKSLGYGKKKGRETEEGIEKGSRRREKTKEKEGEETQMKRKRVQEKERKGERRQSEADVLGSFRAMSRRGVQTSHGQHTKHRTQCPDPDSCR